MENVKDIYFGEVLLNTDVCDGDTVFVHLGGNASADMWDTVAKAMQSQGGGAALRVKVKQMGKQPKREQPTPDGGIYEERAKELAAKLLGNVLDDMQQRAEDGMLVMVDDDGNAHMIDTMYEEGEQTEQPTDAEGKLMQQVQRMNKWAQQQEGV